MTSVDWMWLIGLTLGVEALTCALRFGCRLEATRDTRFVARWTRGFRVHHGYVGVLALPFALVPGPVGVWFLRLGGALLLSDLVHHFLVLWPLKRDHEFHVRYPDNG